MTPGNKTSSDVDIERNQSTETTKFIPKGKPSNEDHSESSESQETGSDVNQLTACTKYGPLPPTFIDKLLELKCTRCNTQFSSKKENEYPFFAYCDIVCGQCANTGEFTGTRCETCKLLPNRVEDAGEKEYKRFDALLDIYKIVETAKIGYRCTKCDKLNPCDNTVRCVDIPHVDEDGVKNKSIDRVVCVWCARKHHEGHACSFLNELRDQPSEVYGNEFNRSFDFSCMKPYFLIHCAKCGLMFLPNILAGKPSAITISCGHLIGTDSDTCCDGCKKESYDWIDCKFCGKKVQKGSELRHFKYLNNFLEEFGDEQICNEGCELRHSEKNCEYINKCIWCVIRNRKPKKEE
ncbi:hypothetical protein PRIPAC_80894 [Pristionchus pacificus]|uniref:Uncharacterized protein n=1 Tax=Pristionchus pacificus TaxID=54126 RepID=A0A2A6C386_PRIPA|nr:hypothetical protein PRIPAC_80894 [Pristionchus pacificus]|eukprot:PDM72567.1 hypothetical protein PRIPAC_39001 [Pristionchus pacificus]